MEQNEQLWSKSSQPIELCSICDPASRIPDELSFPRAVAFSKSSLHCSANYLSSKLQWLRCQSSTPCVGACYQTTIQKSIALWIVVFLSRVSLYWSKKPAKLRDDLHRLLALLQYGFPPLFVARLAHAAIDKRASDNPALRNYPYRVVFLPLWLRPNAFVLTVLIALARPALSHLRNPFDSKY